MPNTERAINPGIAEAIAYAGSQTKLAMLLGVSQSAISSWLLKSKPIPAERAVHIEKATHGRVLRNVLRPDLWEPRM